MRAHDAGEGDGTYIPVAAAALLFGVCGEGVNSAARCTAIPTVISGFYVLIMF
jgi:hypothetical protein